MKTTDAQKKICPIMNRPASLGKDYHHSANKGIEIYNMHCLTQDCMAWRQKLVGFAEEGYCLLIPERKA